MRFVIAIELNLRLTLALRYDFWAPQPFVWHVL
jgi:hypothetical protein